MPIDPIIGDLIVENYQEDITRAVEQRRRLDLARGAAGRNRSLLAQTRRRCGAALIRVGEWLQGARRVDRPALPPLEAPTPATRLP